MTDVTKILSARNQIDYTGKEIVDISNWSIGTINDDPYVAPEARTKVLRGSTENHPRLGKKEHLVSSSIVKMDLANHRVETRNTVYRLADINVEYLRWALENCSPATRSTLNLIYGRRVIPVEASTFDARSKVK